MKPYGTKPLDITLFVYKDECFRWVFDDEANKLAQEAFVAGMDEVIDLLVENIPNAYDGFTLCMREDVGSDEFPFIAITHDTAMHHNLLGQSNYYWCNELSTKVWLCNNLYRYVDHTPQTICLWVKN